MEYNYTAIVIRKKEIGETDRLYTFYTLEGGKIQAIGKGVRKPKAKLAGHLETLNQSDIIIARRHGLGNIASALTEGYASVLKSHPEMLVLALGALGAFERLVDFGDPDERVFHLLRHYIETMEKRAEHPSDTMAARLVTQGFLFRLFGELGYRVEISRCAVTGESLRTDQAYLFSPDAGGVVAEHKASQVARALPIGHNAIKLMRIFSTNTLGALHRLQVDERTLRQVEQASKAFLLWHIR